MTRAGSSILIISVSMSYFLILRLVTTAYYRHHDKATKKQTYPEVGVPVPHGRRIIAIVPESILHGPAAVGLMVVGRHVVAHVVPVLPPLSRLFP